VLFVEDGAVDKATYLKLWTEVGDSVESKQSIHLNGTLDAALARLAASNVFSIARRSADGQELVYLSLKFTNNIIGLAELSAGPSGAQIAVRANVADVIAGIQEIFAAMLATSSDA